MQCCANPSIEAGPEGKKMQLVDATAANVTQYAEDFAALIHATGSAQKAETRAKRPDDPDLQPEPDTEVQDERLRVLTDDILWPRQLHPRRGEEGPPSNQNTVRTSCALPN